jgi:hypothetical protein
MDRCGLDQRRGRLRILLEVAVDQIENPGRIPQDPVDRRSAPKTVDGEL